MDLSQYKQAISELSSGKKEILNTASNMRISMSRTSESEPETDETLEFTIVNKNINTPIGMNNILVQGDKLSRKIFFEMNRYFDGVDLSDKKFFINFTNAENQNGTDDISELNITDDKITFEWWVNSDLTVLNGQVTIQLEIADFDDDGNIVYRFLTTPLILTVEKTINPGGEIDGIDYFLDIQFLNKYTEDITYDIASDTEPIKIENRSIVMPFLEDLVVTQDSRSKTLTFIINRYFDNVDFADKTIAIKFKLPDGRGDRGFVCNQVVSDTQIRFDWLIDSKVTLLEGMVTFAIEFIGYNEKGEFTCWNTLSSSLFVSKGLDVDSYIEPPTASWIQSWNVVADRYLRNYLEYVDKVETLAKNVVVINTEISTLKEDFDTKKADFDVKYKDFMDSIGSESGFVLATPSNDGLMSKEDKVVLDNLKTILDTYTDDLDSLKTDILNEVKDTYRDKSTPITKSDLDSDLVTEIENSSGSGGGTGGDGITDAEVSDWFAEIDSDFSWDKW